MSIYKLFVLTTTPIALVMAVQEAYRLAGGLAVIIAVQMLLMSGAFLILVRLGRKERTARPKIDAATPINGEAN